MVLGLFSAAQINSDLDKDSLESSIENYLFSADFQIKRGDYYDAKDNLTQALEIAKTLNNRAKEAVIHAKIAKLEYLEDNTDRALLSLTKAAQIQREINDYSNLGLTYNLRGVIHSNLKEYKTALEYYESSLKSFEEDDVQNYNADVYLNQALVYIKTNDLSVAQNKLENAIVLAKRYENPRVLSTSYIQNANVYFKNKNYNKALEEAMLGLEIANANNFLEIRNDAYLTLSEIYQTQTNYKAANVYLNKHLKLSDSLFNIQVKTTALEKNIQFLRNYKNTDKRQLLEQVTEVDAESTLTRITTILSISLITILSLLTLSLYKNNNIRLRTNNMLQKKNDELVVAKEKAELASKTKANFLSTVTHELRTPLYAVTGLTNLLLDEAPKKSQVQHLKSLKFSGEYLLTFINDILHINKIEANKVDLDPEQFNLKTKIENVIAALSNSAKDNGIKIHFTYEQLLPETFVGDQLKISQILINLLGNAIKFTKDGDIWVRIRKVSNSNNNYRILFEIEDNGIGISQEKQNQMFESFSQGSIQINRKYGGTGLGLSIVKGLIKILKGRISVKSTLGIGTTFFIELPLKHVEPKVIEKIITHKYDNKLDLSSINILVVEDNKINQMITKKILNKMGLTCDIVDNGEDAVSMVKQTNYNVVLMDIHMPGISGLVATERIRKFNKEVTIFALTAVTIEDKMHEFDNAGFDDIISKPFRQETFEQKLFEALSKDTKSMTI
jgi:signal transduction histidine kinase/CheY-like chemotaxis protein